MYTSCLGQGTLILLFSNKISHMPPPELLKKNELTFKSNTEKDSNTLYWCMHSVLSLTLKEAGLSGEEIKFFFALFH